MRRRGGVWISLTGITGWLALKSITNWDWWTLSSITGRSGLAGAYRYHRSGRVMLTGITGWNWLTLTGVTGWDSLVSQTGRG